MAGPNLTKAAEIRGFTKSINMPFVLFGDFNMTPASLLASGWPQSMQATIVKLGVATCNTGSEIDYALVSDSLVPAVRSIAFFRSLSPWRPHAALVLKIAARPRSINVRVVAHQPKVLPLPVPKPIVFGGPGRRR